MVWYLELGATTRFAGNEGRTSTKNSGHETKRKNFGVFKCVVIHLGDVIPHIKENAHAFFVFDRERIQRVTDELHKGRNSIFADWYDSTSVLSQNKLSSSCLVVQKVREF